VGRVPIRVFAKGFPTVRPRENPHVALPAVVGEMPGPDPLHELERREGQIDAAEDHVQRHDGREVQKPGVVRLLKVVNGRDPDTDRR
jgi:hypothetical protein